MKLRAIRVNQWRRFTRPAGIEGLADGLNVLVAPNEAGKSTLVSALQMALFTKHGTGGRDVDALLNHDAPNAPVVEVEFEVRGEPYVLRKRFVRGKQARLLKPDGAELQGEVAEAFLADLLGYTFPGRGVGTADTMGLWSLLWLEQGAGADAIAASDAAQRTVMGALEDTVGNLLGGEQGRRLSHKIRNDLKELVTEAQGQPRGRFRDAIARAENLGNELEALRAAQARTEEDLQAYEAVGAELREKESGGAEAEMERDIAAARARLDDLLTLEADVAAAETEGRRCDDRLAEAMRAVRGRADLLDTIETLEQQLAAARDQLADAEDEATRLESLWRDARTAQEAADAAHADAALALQQAERALAGARLTRDRDALDDAVARVDATASAIATLAARVEANGATREAIAALEELVDRVRSARAAMAAVATLVDFALEEGASGRVVLSQGELPPAGEALELIDPTDIRIEGVGVIRIRPQVGDARALQDRLAQGERALAEALAALGAADLAAARQLGRDRETAVAELRDARGDLERIAPAAQGGADGLRERRDRARAQLQLLAEDGLDLATLPDVEAAQEMLDAAAAAAREAAQAAALAAQAVTQGRAALDDHRDRLRGPQAALANDEAQRRARQDALAAMPTAEALQEAVIAAQAAADAQRAVIDDLRARAAGDTVALARARLQRLEQSLTSWRNGITELKTRRAGLETALARDGAAGLGEKIAAKARELDLATAERERLAREAEILGTLNTVLTGAEREARERFMGPITDKVRPYLQVLFPGADIELDETLGVAAVHRGSREIPLFGQLSMGTREQINTVTRIAIAEMIAEQGRPAMVIIDDGLAHADDHRLGRMFDILTLAAQKVQILVLSCHGRAFERAGGRLLSIREFEETEGLASA